MPLFDLLNSPMGGARNLNSWAFAHAQDHIQILQAIRSKKNVNLTLYQLDPLNAKDLNEWLIRHQAAHDDFNSVLGLSGSDLEEVNFSDEQERKTWTYLNFTEHQAARQALGI